MSASPSISVRDPAGLRLLVRDLLLVLCVVVVAEAIGMVQIPLGSSKIVLQPMLWAIALAVGLALVLQRRDGLLGLSSASQDRIGAWIAVALMPFLVKLGLMVGSSLPQVREAGWALAFQELGHFFGTMCIGLPLALLLGIKREAIGATFSVGREPSLAIIGQRFGMNSPEGRGVMAEYITGTVLGALFIALLTSVLMGMHLFDPRSLAMGAGMGSGSMMAAAVGAIVAQQPPSMAQQIAAIAGAANLLTGVFGIYFTLFVSLPVTIWLYGHLEPVLGRIGRRGAAAPAPEAASAAPRSASARPSRAGPAALPYCERLLVWCGTALFALVGNTLGYHVPVADALPGVAVILAVVIVADAVLQVLPRLPSVFVLSFLAMLVGIPGLLPYSDRVAGWAQQVNFLPFTTVILAMAGLSMVKSLPAFRRLGWRIVVVSLAANAGTFIGAAFIAEWFHR